MAFVFSVPTISTQRKDYESLFALWNVINDLPDYLLDITFNFRGCKFLSHNGVAFLGGLAGWIESRGGRATFQWESLDEKIYWNLAQNGFLYSLGHNQYPWDGNSVPYRMDLEFDKQELMNYLLKSWLGKGWVNISKPLQFSIAGKVVELYDNAFAHSDSEIGVFSCGQHYPNKKWLHLTVVDFGVGIPDRVRSLPQNRHLNTLDALRWAFMRGNSTRNLDMGQGMGLYLLQGFLEKNQGALKIFSNDGYVDLKNGRLEFYYQNVDFSGTFIDIAFQCDEAYYYMGSELF